MIVLKFGGTSLGNANRFKEVAKIIKSYDETAIVVLSAMAGTTNALVLISSTLRSGRIAEAEDMIADLEASYNNTISSLFENRNFRFKGEEIIKEYFDYIRGFAINSFDIFQERNLLAQGELLSSALMFLYLQELNIEVSLISALEFIRVDKTGEPDEFYIKEKINTVLTEKGHPKLCITQGYICRNAYGEIDNLKRGGSDYSATLIGAAVNANEVHIWTDIDGFHNNDPRYVKNTVPLGEMSFDVAAELAYFGAKVLHPSSVLPAKKSNIPVRLKNTMQPLAPGTLITSKKDSREIVAIAAKDGIIAINIISDRMLLAYGFLRRVFEIFERWKTPIDMITTSEIALSVTIDDNTFLSEITDELRQYGTVKVEEDQTIICIAGNFSKETQGSAAKITTALSNTPLRMISYGGSDHNISVLISTEHKQSALNDLNEIFSTMD